MKHYFESTVDGRTFFKTYILFFIPILILSLLTSRPGGGMNSDPKLGLQLLSLVNSYLTMLLQFAFFAYLITTITHRNIGFPFTGSLGEFAPKGALWFFLTIITMGIYGPWFLRNYIRYLLENLSREGKQAGFLGQPGKLLTVMLLAIYLPIIILAIIFAVWFIGSSGGNPAATIWRAAVIGIIVMIFVILIFTWFYFKWLINFEFSGYSIRFQAPWGRTAGIVLGQTLLCLVTIGIYGPAAWIRIFRFVASNIVFEDGEERRRATFIFDGGVGEGFLLMWGQGLLSLITVGIYGSWAMARVSRWIIGNTGIEGDIEI